MAKKQKAMNLYLLSIVAIIVIVGTVFLVLNIGGSSVISLKSSDVTAQAYSATTSASEWRDCGDGEMVRGDIPCSVKV